MGACSCKRLLGTRVSDFSTSFFNVLFCFSSAHFLGRRRRRRGGGVFLCIGNRPRPWVQQCDSMRVCVRTPAPPHWTGGRARPISQNNKSRECRETLLLLLFRFPEPCFLLLSSGSFGGGGGGDDLVSRRHPRGGEIIRGRGGEQGRGGTTTPSLKVQKPLSPPVDLLM